MIKSEIIHFFSSENFFRQKTAEKRQEKFALLKTAFYQEFDEKEISEYASLLPLLESFHEERKASKKALELKRLKARESLPIAAGCNSATEHVKQLPKGKYLLTSAQNNTHINETFLNCLLTFCAHNDAKLLIGRMTYNKNGYQSGINDDGGWYDKKIKPYLVQGHIDLQGAHFLADSNVIPTAKNPLSSFESATGAGIHVIIPHTKISMQMVAALKNSPTKIVTSTGAITLINYIMRKHGAAAALDHNIGAIYVDTTGEVPVIRHIELMPECDCIYDYDRVYFADGISRTIEPGEVAALQPGDIHAEKMADDNLKSIVKLIRELYPENLILHDVIDFSACNHHNIKDCTFNHLQSVNNQSVAGDIVKTAELIDKLMVEMGRNGNILIIESNHDLAINTWLKNSDFKADQVNAVTYLKCMLALYEYQEEYGNSIDFSMLEYAYCTIGMGKNVGNPQLVFKRVDQSCIIAGVEMGYHGHNGANGSKGSPMQFKKLGIALNTGHTHSPSIWGKVYTAGVSASLEMGYNIGASSWAIAHIVTYSNGQRQILFV